MLHGLSRPGVLWLPHSGALRSSARTPLLRSPPGARGRRDSLPDPPVGFPGTRAASDPDHSLEREASNQPAGGTVLSCRRERHSQRKKEAQSTPSPSAYCPAGQMGSLVRTAVLQQRETSHPGGQGGGVPEGATSTRVSETVESGSLQLVPSTCPQTWPRAGRPCPSERTSGAARPPGTGGGGGQASRSRSTRGAQTSTQTQAEPLVPGASCSQR